MPWVAITHACSHRQERRIYGRGETLRRAAAELARLPCTECAAGLRAAHRSVETVGELIDSGSRLELACRDCNHRARLDAEGLTARLGRSRLISTLSFRCSACEGRRVFVQVVTPHRAEGGRGSLPPAEMPSPAAPLQ